MEHDRFAQYLHKFRLKDTPYYACDPAKIQDVLHVLEECQMFLRDRVALEAEMGVVVGRRNFPEIVKESTNRDKFLRIVTKLSEYTKEARDEALEKINTKAMSLRAVTKKYKIPRANLQFKLKNSTSKSQFGPTRYLSTTIAEWLINMARTPRSIKETDRQTADNDENKVMSLKLWFPRIAVP
ncbi:hypothetical protein EVAR_10286_1 [Eumeta japonica]|uniref:Uncharacterized protein n=1 Tax=Eumeta variegata TaxID=151549 RepID=A0A4C1TH64_EUMVA|nr:hypothetical protein EVAR_10286_1 [Eumeta japonica]